MEDKHLHLISFDIPYPADYGGVIDVYHKLINFKKAGIKIILHCYFSKRTPQGQLDDMCEKVFYYKRSSVLPIFSTKPYIVASRNNQELLNNLLQDQYPIFFEGIHTTHLLNHPSLKDRKKIVRLHNIEHRYYKLLAKSESNLLKKIFFHIESFKLYHFEKRLKYADVLLPISELEYTYFKKAFPSKTVELVNAFSKANEVSIKTGKGKYVLYHGNLSVNENEIAALYLIKNLSPYILLPLVIAGKNPSEKLKRFASDHTIELISNPSEESLSELISNAHINIVFSLFETGTKLKLLHVLFGGRFCLANDNVLLSPALAACCIRTEDAQTMIEVIKVLQEQEFGEKEIRIRTEILTKNFLNEVSKIIGIL
ncbi:MAG: hypothetical protein J7604_14120 [Sporocytophaga sp.]|uniref:hypothetical protein n=1 Tax=Sporocytophaga sp. TaxID=2231183 RepID=UPI001B1F5DFC|nr:hypothetical protein [Sporocytophaga sp.]MBO9701341.1 hypothetical protein [Sporocytophaga sp.]